MGKEDSDCSPFTLASVPCLGVAYGSNVVAGETGSVCLVNEQEQELPLTNPSLAFGRERGKAAALRATGALAPSLSRSEGRVGEG